MYAQVEKSKVNKRRAVANSVTIHKSNAKQGFGVVDNRLKSTSVFHAVTQKKEKRGFDFMYDRQKRIIQRSWTGKAGTLLGTAVVGGLSALALPAILPIAASTAAITGGLGYLGYKSKFGGPFIGGRTNVDTLQEGNRRGRTTKLGVGLINKKHLFSHSVAVIDKTSYDQRLNGEVGAADLVKTLYRRPQKSEAQAKFDTYDNFDMTKGRVVTIKTRIRNAELGRLEVGKKRRSGASPYGLLSNSCSSNVADVLNAAGLTPPLWAKTPILLHKWMKSMDLLQRVIPDK